MSDEKLADVDKEDVNKDSTTPENKEESIAKTEQEKEADKTLSEADKKVDEAKDKEENPYAQENERLKKLVGHKEDVIKDTKEKLKDAKESLGDFDPEEFKKSIMEEVGSTVKEAVSGARDEITTTVLEEKVDTLISKYSNNKDEQELIKTFYNEVTKSSKVYPTLDEKIQAAKLLANKNLIFNEGVKEGQEISREELLKGFGVSKSQTGGGTGEPEAAQDPLVGAFIKHSKYGKAIQEQIKK